MYTVNPDQFHVSDTLFQSNMGSLGGAVYIAAEEDNQTLFSACVFEGNEAGDGGAVYLYTGAGLGIFNSSAFNRNYAGGSPEPPAGMYGSGACKPNIVGQTRKVGMSWRP